MTTPKEPRIPIEEMAYMKMGENMTKEQRQKWNQMKHEMWLISDFMLDRSRFSGHSDKAERLHALIGQLPIFDLDGKGFSRSGGAIEDF